MGQRSLTNTAIAALVASPLAVVTVLVADATGHAWATPTVIGVTAGAGLALTVLALCIGLYAAQDQKLDDVLELFPLGERIEGAVDELRTTVASAIRDRTPASVTTTNGGRHPRVSPIRPGRP